MSYETLNLSIDAGVASVALNRPSKANAMNRPMWEELRKAFQAIDRTPEARVAVLTGNGDNFTAGIDLSMLASLAADTAKGGGDCQGRAREKLYRGILDLQNVITSVDRCTKPVLAAIHGACVGGGVDLVTACDMRYCSADAYFVVKEIDLAIVADVGTLQRLPRVIGDGMARELAYTGRRVGGAEAREIGLVNRCYASREELRAGVIEIARSIAAKSPLAVRGTKEMLRYARDHTVEDGLNYVATWNAAMLMSADVEEAMRAAREKRAARFGD
jgi:enoyl-CoA hydratase